MANVHTIVFAKAPVAGFAKTRLIPALGAVGAAQLAQKMLAHTLEKALACQTGTVELCTDPSVADAPWCDVPLPIGVVCTTQGDGDLGQRMARAASRSLLAGHRVLLIGTDCPELSVAALQAAAADLSHCDASLVPTLDGGYCLLGLNQFDASLFDDMPWSTSKVAQITLQRLQRLGWHTTLGPTLHDIDEPDDLRWLPPSWGYAQGVHNEHPCNEATRHSTKTY
jgi:uncharacterized protein